MDNFLNLGLGNYVVLDDVTNLHRDNQIVDGLCNLYFDGSCSRNGFGIGVVIKGPDSKMHPHAYKLKFECKNNEAEYEALIQGLELARHMGVKFLYVL